jgi:hypothetical protein
MSDDEDGDCGLEDKVLRWVKTSGATVEMNVARVMLIRGFDVMQSLYYTDPEVNVSREIDVIAAREVQIEDGKRIGAYLAIECKYAPTPWVLFRGGPSYDEGRSNFERIVTTYGGQWLQSARRHPAIEQSRFFQQEPRVGYSLTTSNLGDKNKRSAAQAGAQDLAYKALHGATKAARYFASALDSSMTTFGVIFPGVVLQGKLFEAWLDGEEPRVREIHQGQVRWSNPADERPVLVDVVTLEWADELARQFGRQRNCSCTTARTPPQVSIPSVSIRRVIGNHSPLVC